MSCAARAQLINGWWFTDNLRVLQNKNNQQVKWAISLPLYNNRYLSKSPARSFYHLLIRMRKSATASRFYNQIANPSPIYTYLPIRVPTLLLASYIPVGVVVVFHLLITVYKLTAELYWPRQKSERLIASGMILYRKRATITTESVKHVISCAIVEKVASGTNLNGTCEVWKKY